MQQNCMSRFATVEHVNYTFIFMHDMIDTPMNSLLQLSEQLLGCAEA